MATKTRTTIAVHGARVHNLKNISVEIPRDKLIVVTGLSGSGKSSLAFDTIYAEGQRRYMESCPATPSDSWRRWRSPVDFIYGLSPVISIEQKTMAGNPRSTVGRMTDIASYLNLLFGVKHRGQTKRAGIRSQKLCFRHISNTIAQHLLGSIDAGDPKPASYEGARHSPGAAAPVEHSRARRQPMSICDPLNSLEQKAE